MGRLSRRRVRVARAAGFGPMPYEAKQQQDATSSSDDVGRRVAYVVGDNAKGISEQLRQYGYSQVDGFLGGEIHGFPEKIREEMKRLFDRGWFEQESEQDATFKVGMVKLRNQDRDNRFMMDLFAPPPGDDKGANVVETQFEVAPTVVNFTRSLIASLAGPIGRIFGGKVSTQVAMARMHVFCGEGARFDRRVSNEWGWRTEQGFAPDSRKLTVVYFANPRYREELGGHFQLEGVITPTGGVSVEPFLDRLLLFWSDKTVWSVRPSQAGMISEHLYCIIVHLMVEDHGKINYKPKELARWFPELRGEHMPDEWPPKTTPMIA